MNKKITNKEMFTILASIVSAAGVPAEVETSMTPDEIIGWINGRIEQLEKKSTTISKKKKEEIEANNSIMDEIVSVLEANVDGLSVTDIIKSSPTLADLSSQKVTALLKKMTEAETVVKAKVKGKSIYKINDGTTDVDATNDVQD